MTGRGDRPASRMEVEDRSEWRGPLRWIAFGCLLTFLIGITIFAIVSRKATGDPAPEGESLHRPPPSQTAPD